MDSYTNVIELDNVVKDYGDFKLDNIRFSVPKGSVCGFIGQNGAGKTTTIRLMLDVIKADSGEIKLFGEDIKGNAPRLREDIGVVYDEMGFHEFMSGKDINIMMRHIYKNWDENVFFDYLKKFSLPSKKKCGDFSRGMRMKLQIAVALSHNAKLLVMDEPTAGLDPIVRNEILDIFREITRSLFPRTLPEISKRSRMKWSLSTAEKYSFKAIRTRFWKTTESSNAERMRSTVLARLLLSEFMRVHLVLRC